MSARRPDLGDLGLADGLQEIDAWRADTELTTLVERCIAAQRTADTVFRPAPAAEGLAAVSEGVLRAILAKGRDVHGVATDPAISNVIVFNASHVAGAVTSRAISGLRARVDAHVEAKLRALVPAASRLMIVPSGHFWYPPGSYMGWHTNSRAPGVRIYVTNAEEPGRSFFRYRDPDMDRVVTAPDDRWNVRVFRVGGEKPFWHAVYSETHRFSFGYMVLPRSSEEWLRRMLGGVPGLRTVTRWLLPRLP
jgi:hypothetical protein